MNVRVEIDFVSPGQAERSAMKSLAKSLTSNSASVQIIAGEAASCLAAEFTMPTEPQHAAVEKIYSAIQFWPSNRTDSAIYFPKSQAEREREAHKAERRRAKRRAKKG
jgi:hypothetical protein